ncbi:MAG TPA: 4'-phosphopantetheinyl transferase superfamily protein [Pilimelia sp.]|nr:4'-phosphopantetheinyl transferase superfamily protein [Pilimelia sp.]
MTVWLARVDDVRPGSRALLVGAAGAALGLPPQAIEVTKDPGGRPRLVGEAAGLHVAVSHTRGIAAVATSRLAPVGVDVEAVRPLPSAALARRWLLPAEADWLAAQPAGAQAAAFLLLWTYKEAVGKARGTGLRGGGLRQPAPLPGPGGLAPAGRDGAVVLRPVPGDADLVAGVAVTDPGLVLAVAAASAAASGSRPVVREFELDPTG